MLFNPFITRMGRGCSVRGEGWEETSQFFKEVKLAVAIRNKSYREG